MGNGTGSKKLQKNLNVLPVLLSANFAAHRVFRLQFFPCDDNEIIPENFIAIASEKLQLQLLPKGKYLCEVFIMIMFFNRFCNLTEKIPWNKCKSHIS